MHKSSFRAEVLPQKVRHKRDVVFSFEDLLGNKLAVCFFFSNPTKTKPVPKCRVVSFGGAASLFVGCSAWKLARLGYILLEKLGQLVDWLVHHRRVGRQPFEFVH